jgi:hypothetical protein
VTETRQSFAGKETKREKGTVTERKDDRKKERKKE